MEKTLRIAGYIANRFQEQNNQKIDEMKLHKLMYFAQRESYIQMNQPLFDATFYGWKYGPVLKEIRRFYKDGSIHALGSFEFTDNNTAKILDKVFNSYADKDSWSLSRLTHGELSWKNSRIGIPPNANGDQPMNNEDIQKDAERIRNRRKMLAEIGL